MRPVPCKFVYQPDNANTSENVILSAHQRQVTDSIMMHCCTQSVFDTLHFAEWAFSRAVSDHEDHVHLCTHAYRRLYVRSFRACWSSPLSNLLVECR